MARSSRGEADHLGRRLEEKWFDFDFFQAVRRIECANPDCARIGRSQRPGDDPVRFCQYPSLAFAPAAISGYDRGGRVPRLFITFLGMLGPNGPLPAHLTEYARERLLNHRDKTFAHFLDVFNHRMLSLFYRAWAVNRQTVSYDRRHEDRFSAYVSSLFGMGMASLRNRDRAPDDAKRFYSGWMVCQTRHADGLEALLNDFFQLPAKVEQFVGEWMDLPEEFLCRLGGSPESCSLGSTAIVGARLWECQQKFRITFGPVGLRDYQRLLPGGESMAKLVDWIRNYVGYELRWDVRLILKAEEVPQVNLGALGQLGWTTWLKSSPTPHDADDLVVRPQVA